VKISSNWSKIRSGMSGLPASSRSTSSRWCRNSQSDSPAAATPTCVHCPAWRAVCRIVCLICSAGSGASAEYAMRT
jgi:hypothetical protein